MKRASRYLMLLAFSVSLGTVAVGCRTMNGGFGSEAEFANTAISDHHGDENDCQTGECEDCQSHPRRWTQAWYDQVIGSPVGARQVYKAGQYWPPFPRPQGRKQQFSEKFHAAHYWPHPYNCQDRAYLKEMSARQIANGWKNEATLYSYHFDADTNELTHTGRNHLRWIMDWVPEQYRTIWVQKGINAQINDIQLASVRKATAEFVTSGDVPSIELRTAVPPGRPADEIQTIHDLEINSMPNPHISATSSSSGSGSGGAAQGTGTN